MRVACFYGPGDLRLEDAPEPVPARGEITIRVRACSLCGTDLKIVTHGSDRLEPPRVLGHEIAGEVAEAGQDADEWRPGDRVQVAAAIGCGRCRDCGQGHDSVCGDRKTFGYDYDGAFAGYLRVPARVLAAGGVNRIPAGVSFAEASVTEPLACVINGQQLAGVQAGDDVVVIGAGPIGCLHARLARSQGAGRVFIADLGRPERLARAAVLAAADAAIDAARIDLVSEVRRLTGGRGADVVIAGAASQVVQQQAVRMAAARGRVSLFAGLPKGSGAVSLDTNLIHYRELRVTGVTGASPSQNTQALALIGTGQVAAGDLITHRFPLEEIHAALGALRDGAAIKITVEP